LLEKSIRLKDVAKAAGVSQGTASNVFNRPQLVRPEVRARVEATAKSLGYGGPDMRGRLLRAGKVNAIGIAVPEPLPYLFADPFARVLMSAIAEECDAAGAGLALISAINEERVAWNVETALVDGMILLCLERGTRLVNLARDRRLPFVALQMGVSDEGFSAVGIDNFSAGLAAGRHIVGLGHRRIAILSLHSRAEDVDAADFQETQDRLGGYLAALAEAGIERSGVPIFATNNDPQAARRATAEMFHSAGERPTAIIAMSDLTALAAMDWLHEAGIGVPDEVSVIGFDDIPEAVGANPPLTTIAQPIADIGRVAVRLILRAERETVQQELPTALVVRGSTARAPA